MLESERGRRERREVNTFSSSFIAGDYEGLETKVYLENHKSFLSFF